jgi:hypothetical protein
VDIKPQINELPLNVVGLAGIFVKVNVLTGLAPQALLAVTVTLPEVNKTALMETLMEFVVDVPVSPVGKDHV